MKLTKLQDLLDARGADLSAWPPRDRAAAERLIAGSPDAADLHRRARAFEQALRDAAPSRVSDDFAQSVMARLDMEPEAEAEAAPATARQSAPRTAGWLSSLMRPAWIGASATLAASLSVGFYLGTTDIHIDALDGPSASYELTVQEFDALMFGPARAGENADAL